MGKDDLGGGGSIYQLEKNPAYSCGTTMMSLRWGSSLSSFQGYITLSELPLRMRLGKTIL